MLSLVTLSIFFSALLSISSWVRRRTNTFFLRTSYPLWNTLPSPIRFNLAEIWEALVLLTSDSSHRRVVPGSSNKGRSASYSDVCVPLIVSTISFSKLIIILFVEVNFYLFGVCFCYTLKSHDATDLLTFSWFCPKKVRAKPERVSDLKKPSSLKIFSFFISNISESNPSGFGLIWLYHEGNLFWFGFNSYFYFVHSIPWYW